MEMRPLRPTVTTFKKTFLHTFLPTKQEEDQHMNNSSIIGPQPCRFTKRVIEIRDVYPYQPGEWSIRRNLTHQEIRSGKILLSHAEVFDHVFRFWTLEKTTSLAISGNSCNVQLWDLTDANHLFLNNLFSLDLRVDEDYELACAGLFRRRNLQWFDEIGLKWSVSDHAFVFKLLHRNVILID